jgi:hypothetical protein
MPALCAVSVMLVSCDSQQWQPRELSLSSSVSGTGRASLLYLTNMRENEVQVYSYPAGRKVGQLTGFGRPRSECADQRGDVWIADAQALQITEYAHGGTKPIAALSTSGVPNGCAASSSGDDVAVSGAFQGGVALTVFHRSTRNRWRDPRAYIDSSMHVGEFCGYDADGDLFIDGLSSARRGRFVLAELPRGADTLIDVAVSQPIKVPGQVQWDGHYVAIGDAGVAPSVVYQFSVSSSTATLASTTTLGKTKSVRQFWIDGDGIIGPDVGKDVGLWAYPKGGSPTRVISIPGYGAAVSR